jgi:exopolysaccharide production protein ExoZ
MGVVVCHSLKVPLGAAGVDLFFVISGFIIGKVMVGRAPGAFLFDRFWRIYPIYWLCSVPWFFIAWWSGQLEPVRTISSLSLWPIFGEFVQPYLRPGWTLSYEMLFYLAAAAALATGRGRWLIAAFAAFFIANLAAPSPLLGFLGYPPIFEFLAGLALGRARLDPRAGAATLVLGIAILLMSPASLFQGIAVSDTTALLRVLWWGIPSIGIVYGALSLERFVTSKPAILLGDASYSIYLTHLTVIMFVPGWPAVPLCALVGIAAHRWA